MNVYQKLNKARKDLKETKLKKSGRNDYAKFDYYQLQDFIPKITDIFNELGLMSQFTISTSQKVGNDGVIADDTHADLAIINCDQPTEVVLFTTPVAEAKIGSSEKQNPIQQLGATHTYLRRYLWMNAMEITEPDQVDATSGRATEKQVALLKKFYVGDNLTKLLEKNNISNIEELSIEKASELIKKMKEASDKNDSVNNNQQ